ncbi:MAG: hypothetical protein FJ405_02035 [Verrucomicrobia bacterium]|nr:hypothetical protein [Verrucomicrobiota bacterium]
MGDRRRLYQVLRHLVDNAIKFTEQGEVTLRMCPRGEDSAEPSLTFRVSDTGPGIATEDQVRILRPFSQVDSSRTRQHGGIGMGLILSDRLVQLMGGQLDLSSEPGRGTTVQFHLKPSAGSCASAAA